MISVCRTHLPSRTLVEFGLEMLCAEVAVTESAFAVGTDCRLLAVVKVTVPHWHCNGEEC